MPKLSFERRVAHSAEQMLSLVADMRSYPDFVPNCTAMTVHDEKAEGSEVRQLATMTAQLGPLTQAYTSKVVTDRDAGLITTDAIDGPFSHLSGRWSFTPDGSGAFVRFDIDFGFANRLVAAVAEPAFGAKQSEIMDAFLREADRRFG